MKKWIFWIVAIILLIFGVYFFFLREKAPQYETHEVRKENLVQTVSVTGELKIDTDLNLDFETTGRITSINAKIGQQVAKGDILATIDDRVLSGEVASAKAELDRALANVGISDEQIKRLQVEVDNAKKVVSDTEDLDEQKKDESSQVIDSAQNYYDDAKDYYEQVVDDSGAGSAEAKNAKLSLTRAENDLEAARQTKKTLEETGNLNETNAKNALRSAEEELRVARSNSQQALDDADVKAARARYDIALANLTKTNVVSPINGTITRVNYKPGAVFSGISTISTEHLISMVSDDYLIEANVPESDVSKVRLGQVGVTTFDSLSDADKFDVRVIEIEPAATLIQDVVYYKVKFAMQNSLDSRLKPGMTANIDIVTQQKNQTLAIPQRLLQEDGDIDFVEVLNADGAPEKRNVKLGFSADEGMVEIVSGLKEGDRVVVSGNNK